MSWGLPVRTASQVAPELRPAAQQVLAPHLAQVVRPAVGVLRGLCNGRGASAQPEEEYVRLHNPPALGGFCRRCVVKDLLPAGSERCVSVQCAVTSYG